MNLSTAALLRRVEALELASANRPAHHEGLASQIARVFAAAAGEPDREQFLRELVRRVDSGLATDEDLARVGGANLDLVRVVARLEGAC